MHTYIGIFGERKLGMPTTECQIKSSLVWLLLRSKHENVGGAYNMYTFFVTTLEKFCITYGLLYNYNVTCCYCIHVFCLSKPISFLGTTVVSVGIIAVASISRASENLSPALTSSTISTIHPYPPRLLLLNYVQQSPN